jgi:hypothetical protein
LAGGELELLGDEQQGAGDIRQVVAVDYADGRGGAADQKAEAGRLAQVLQERHLWVLGSGLGDWVGSTELV